MHPNYKSAIKRVYFENFEPSPLYKFSLPRYASILHTGFSGSNSYLFRIKCKLSPGVWVPCALCCTISFHVHDMVLKDLCYLVHGAVQLLGNVYGNKQQ